MELKDDYLVVLADARPGSESKAKEFAELMKHALENNSFLLCNNSSFEVVEIKIECYNRRQFHFYFKLQTPYGPTGSWESDLQRVLWGEFKRDLRTTSTGSGFRMRYIVPSPQRAINYHRLWGRVTGSHKWQRKVRQLFNLEPAELPAYIPFY